MAAMGDDVEAGTVSRPGHGLRQPHDRREPCLFHIHTNQTKPHYAEAVGLEGTRQLFLTLFEAFPDVRVSIDSIGAEGDRVWVRITMRGTQQGPFMGVPATGKTFAAATVNEVRIQDGKLVEEWGVTDTLSMWQQLGIGQATS